MDRKDGNPIPHGGMCVCVGGGGLEEENFGLDQEMTGIPPPLHESLLYVVYCISSLNCNYMDVFSSPKFWWVCLR